MSSPGSGTGTPGTEESLRASLTARFTAPGAVFEVVEQVVEGLPMRLR
jgi:hypothetical protein